MLRALCGETNFDSDGDTNAEIKVSDTGVDVTVAMSSSGLSSLNGGLTSTDSVLKVDVDESDYLTGVIDRNKLTLKVQNSRFEESKYKKK